MIDSLECTSQARGTADIKLGLATCCAERGDRCVEQRVSVASRIGIGATEFSKGLALDRLSKAASGIVDNRRRELACDFYRSLLNHTVRQDRHDHRDVAR